MYVAAYGLGGTIADIRKAIHKVIPRELSPTRLLEKFATDTKKKGAAKLQAVSDDADARDAAAQASYDAQIANIQALANVAPAISAPLPFAAPPPAVRPARNYLPYVVGGAVLLLMLALAAKGNRR